MALSSCVGLAVELGQLDPGCRLPAFLAMLGNDVGENAATYVELGGQTHEARLQGFDEIVKDAVGDGFVKTALVAERPDVELQAFEFDAGFLGDVVENQGGEVRLSGHRAQAGEFGNFHMDVEIPLWRRVREGLQGFARLCAHVGRSVERVVKQVGETNRADKMLL